MIRNIPIKEFLYRFMKDTGWDELLHPPRDVLAGCSIGVWFFVNCLLTAMHSVLWESYKGYRRSGIKGMLCGLCYGTTRATFVSFMGAMVGTLQLVRGMLNTPHAISMRRSGKRWDNGLHKWVDYNLKTEYERIGDNDDDLLKSRHRRNKQLPTNNQNSPIDITYYETLGVNASATTRDIQRAYYQLARQLHPDKNPDNPNAKAQFQRVSEAYQVLSNPTTRTKYDQQGSQGVKDENILDASTCFSMVFGNEKFEHLVGRLSTTLYMDYVLTSKERSDLQDRREIRLASNLCNILQPFVDGDVHKFNKEVERQCQLLQNIPFGCDVLHTVGRSYRLKAIQAIKPNMKMDIYETRNIWKSRITTASAAWALVVEFCQSVSISRPNNRQALAHQVLPSLLQASWEFSLMDMETTTLRVCHKALYDVSATLEERQKRAQALLILADAFEKTQPMVPSSVKSRLRDFIPNM